MKVTMTSSVREYNVTIDGVTKSMSTLPAGKIYLDPPDEWGLLAAVIMEEAV